MHLILTGATGLCGSAVLDAMIKSKDITKISIISRRPVKMAEDSKDPRINVLLHKNFEQYDAKLLSQLKGARGCVWALGISQTEVGAEEYVKITKDYALRAAEAFQTLGSDTQPFNFVYVSGDGTTHTPGRFTPIFGRVKGETELLLAAMRKANPSFHASAIRPAFIDAAAHDAIKPYLPVPGLAKAVLLPPFAAAARTFMRSKCSPTEPLARFMTDMAMGKLDARLQDANVEKVGDFPILENSMFRELAGLDDKKDAALPRGRN
ncbi:hypothetical protein N0V93_004480 [Gnomoniopsis smithogilvyi]|uniref:Nucleoside-diphosphate-sugar epimerase n=1 Tax=Gnomoniopsis smithogilvyi TaxID=1191159 RepID=A0A9W8YR57_9PEZI|nr:hypothetical protein N0V93_004480 [Gnomoniopsis smithogilvyi]